MSDVQVSRLVAILCNGGVTGVQTEDLQRVKDSVEGEIQRRAGALVFEDAGCHILPPAKTSEGFTYFFQVTEVNCPVIVRGSNSDVFVFPDHYFAGPGKCIRSGNVNSKVMVVSRYGRWEATVMQGSWEMVP